MATIRRPPRLTVVEIGDDNPVGDRPIVRIVQGRRSDAIEAAEGHLVEHHYGCLFQRAGRIVRVGPQPLDLGGGVTVETLEIIEVENEYLRLCFNQAADLRKFDRRTDSWISVDCPKDFAAAYREMRGKWKLPPLRCVVTAPTLRPDGSLITRPGYDAASGIYYDPRGVEFPPVPSAPTREQALAALDRLESLFGTLEIADELSRSVSISALMTAVVRPALRAAPLHAVSAPVAGSGKSKIVNCAAIIATGHPTPVLAIGAREEETEKRIGGALIAGMPLIAIDNTERPLGGEFLCQAITEPLVAPRILGVSELMRVPNTATWFATGNNLKLSGDMVRRALLLMLDPKCERPELREFETPDPCLIAQQQRAEFVVAVLTIVRAFIVAGRPRECAPIGSFEDWSGLVRDALIWLGRPDPADAMGEARREDPVLAGLIAVVEQWRKAIGSDRVTARQIVGIAEEHGEFREALAAVGGEGGKISTGRLGKWLGKVKGRRVNGMRIEDAGYRDGIALWQVSGS